MKFKFCLIFILVACTPHLNFGQPLDYGIIDNPAQHTEDSDRFPFVCLVVIMEQFCTGSIVASKAVLTSKRCLFNNKDYRNYQNYKNMVYSGVYGNSNPHDSTQSVEVNALLPYSWNDDLPKFDIMLVLLKEHFKWDKTTQPFVLSDTLDFPKEESEHCLLLGLDNSVAHRLSVGFVNVVHPQKCYDDDDDDDNNVVDPEVRLLATVCSLIESEEDNPKQLLTGGLVITQGVQIAILSVVTPKHVNYSYVGFFKGWILRHAPQVAFHAWIRDYEYGSEGLNNSPDKYPPLTTILASQLLLLLQTFLRMIF